MIRWHEASDAIGYAVTDRLGGVSQGPYAGCNLGDHVGDDPVAVRANRAAVLRALGHADLDLVLMDQVHGADVAVLDAPPPQPPRTDAIVTGLAGVVLGVVVADCVPILLSDAGAGVIGVIHAGRPGFTGGIVDITLDAMAGLGARDIRAVVGPSVCGRCYEVPVAMVSEAAEVAPEATAVSWSGTPAIDVASGVIARMAARGASVTWLSGCTREDDTLYSYRRDGTTGRFAGLIWREHSGAEAAGQQR